MANELQGLEELLTYRIGLDTNSVGSQLIMRAVKQRMRDLKLDELAVYSQLVRQSAVELQELIEEVIVAESWFFRDERPFLWFREYARTGWLNKLTRSPLRVLSLACAGGEEPYSIAITLSELGLPSRRYRIDAIDISERRLANARRGVFSQNAFRGPANSYQTRYFRVHPEGYEIDPAIRKNVRFIQGNILDPHTLEGCSGYDVIFCRNVLIYLIPSARAGLMSVIESVLASDGVLVIGHADRHDSTGTGTEFRAIAEPGCFAYRRAVSADPTVAAVRPLPSLLVKPEPLLPTPIRETELSGPPATLTAAVVPVASTVLHASIPIAAEPVPLLDQAARLANKGHFVEAMAVCEQHLRQKGFTAPAYYLLGMICQAAGDRRRAEDCFQKTVYLDPSNDEALLALALLAERRGDQNAANGFRRRAERMATISSKRVN
jgi:chemotaxis protein methyltransferase WspC